MAPPAGVALTITDDDTRGVVISEASVSVRESDDAGAPNREDQATYTVKLASQPTGGDVTIAVASEDTDAATVSPVSLVFTAANWSEAQIVTVSGMNDDIDNTNDRRTTRITHTVSAEQGADYASVTAKPVAVTVNDDDGPPTGVRLSVNPASVDEVAVATEVTVTATAVGGSTFAESKTVRVTVGAAADSAKAPADYAAVSAFDVTIAAGATSGTQTFMLTPVDDDIDEGAGETISVNGTLPGFTIAPVNVTLTDDDERGVSIDPETLTLDEADDAATQGTTENAKTYDVVLDSQPTGAVTVNLSNSDASVVSLNKTSLSFNATNWNTGRTVTVTAVADAFDNTGNKRAATISHTVSAVGTDYAGETAAPVEVTVTDDDEAPTQATLTVSTSSVSEGGGATEVTVTATLVGTSRFAEAKTVVVAVGNSSDDSATQGTDYKTVGALNITIAGGAASGSAKFSLEPTDDDWHEGDERLSIAGALTGVTFTDTHIDITDDDAAPTGVTLSVDPASVSEGATKATEVTVTATVTGGTTYAEDKTVTVSVGEADDSAKSGVDYTAVSDIDIDIAAGAASATGTFSLDATDDTLHEAEERLSITGSETGGATITGAQVSITDNDPLPVLSISSPDVEEGDSGTASLAFEVTLAPVSGREVTVAYGVTGGTAKSGADYAALTAGTLTFAAGDTTKTVTVSVTGDTLDEADETVILRLSSASGATLTGGESTLDATGTITDDDAAPSVSVADAAAVTEGDDPAKTMNMTFTVSLSVVSGKTVTVPYTLGGEATAGSDYTAPDPLSVTIAPGDESADITIAVKGDVIDESHETVTVTLGVPTNATVSKAEGAGSASGTITDDEETPTVELVLTPASIAESGTGNRSTVTATLSGESSEAVVLTVSATAVAPAVAADFTQSGSKLTIAAGALSSSGLVTVTAVDNAVDAANKQVTVSASATGGHDVTAPANAALTITDDDERGVVISEAAVSVKESDDAGTPSREDQATYTVKLASEPTGGAVTIAVASEDTDAATVSPASLVFTADNWSEAQIVTVSGVNDDIDNTNDRRETRITHTVSVEQGADYASVTAKPVAVTVTDDDGPPTGVTLSVNPASVAEVAVATEVTVTATAVGGSTFAESKTVRVTVGAATDSAKAPADYAAVSAFDVTIAAGATSGTQTFMLTPVDDAIDEESGETISVSGALSGFTIAPVSVTLTDNDVRGVSIAPKTLTLGEADDAATQDATENAKTYDVVLDSQPTGAVTVNLSNSDASVVSLSDSSLSFNATNWNTAQTVTVTAVADAFDNTGDKRTATIGHTVSAPGADYAGETAAPVEVTVTDDDDAPTQATLTVSTSSVSEGGGATEVTVTATLVGTSRFAEAKTVTVKVGQTGDRAEEGTDYTQVADQTITIAGGAASGSVKFSLEPTDDDWHEGDERLSVAGALAGVNFTGAHIDITDDDAAPTGVTLTVNPASVSEGAKATDITVTATVNGSTTYSEGKTVTVSVGDSADSAKEGTDYEAVTDITIALAAGADSATGTFSLEPKDDSADEPTETLSISGSETGGATVSGTQVSLTDDDVTPIVLSRSGGAAFIEEDGGSVEVSVSLGRELATGERVTVPLVVSGATVTTHYTLGLKAAATGVTLLTGTPHSAQNPALVFAGSSASSATLTLTAVNNDDETERTVSIAYGASARAPSSTGLDGGLSTSGSSLVVPIADDDALITIAAAEAAEGRRGGVHGDLAERGALTGGVTIDYATSDGRGEATDEAYQVATSADYTAAANDASMYDCGGSERCEAISVATTQDNTYEGDHYFTVTLSNPSRMTVSRTAGSAVGTITDAADTPVFAFSSATGSVDEGDGTVTLTVDKSGTSLVASTVDYATADGTAEAGEDYTAKTGTLSFAAADTSKTLTVTIADDVIDEVAETFAVALTAGAHAALGTVNSQTVTITDDDDAPDGIALSVSPSSVAENDSATDITVTAKVTGGTTYSEDKIVTVAVGETATAPSPVRTTKRWRIRRSPLALAR